MQFQKSAIFAYFQLFSMIFGIFRQKMALFLFLELSYWALDMFLYMSEGSFTQILESQKHLSKKLKSGILGQKSELFTKGSWDLNIGMQTLYTYAYLKDNTQVRGRGSPCPQKLSGGTL